ncbi:DEAD/DEAH box helicase [Xenorhabdus sp. 12]|uniref:DEAD/DEAH box helicase n=1 Tax=Xenorhabdus santafensis TaxID=2582833 RepID=A0ABU4SEZ2_9GAMM|nr:DEAD/DEAH box helicase family protein [Xenorhabdus sp. 12]MDX7989377.1 DEAD/DEAH box helicase [Xenorhabdus sp. 12]
MKTNLSILKKEERFYILMRKLSLDSDITSDEIEYILSCCVIFIKEYERDKRRTPYFELAYYISLKCAVNLNIYEPILDISTNLGLYPISKYILKHNLGNVLNTLSFSIDYQLDRFRYNNIIETFEQKRSRENITFSEKQENCYVAPTSYGKSSLIIEIIKNKKMNRIGIIVPTKSLLIQTYKNIKIHFSDKNIIFHDEMFNNETVFIAVFTQERALRLLKNKELSFDVLIVDEAHKIFESDKRSILLTRLIRRNRKRNKNSINYYLSPLISDSTNLMVSESQEIFERKIINNIKEPDIFEYKKDGNVVKYDRFMDSFYHFSYSSNYLDYISHNLRGKNFFFLRRPMKVEQLAKDLAETLPDLKSERLNELAEVISNNVHKDFYCVDYIKKGLVYLHGKLPDLIKEYLEFKFHSCKEITHIIANTVILEGVNLPIDNLFIMDTYGLDNNSLSNLIGRVNRLNEVFDDSNKSLSKLLPPVHFVNTTDYSSSNMGNKIKKLKHGITKDDVKNPLLKNFNIEKYRKELKGTNDFEKITMLENKLNYIDSLREQENFLELEDGNPASKIEQIFLESGLTYLYRDFNLVLPDLKCKIETLSLDTTWMGSDMIEKIYLFFIHNQENSIKNTEFLRLKNIKARDFYRKFIERQHQLNLKQHISEILAYFHSIKNKESGKEYYIGTSYGEFSKDTNGKLGHKVFIDLSRKNNKDLANIALIKMKIESDFVSYTLNQYVNILYDLDLVTESEYNLHMYGTTKKKNSDFVRMGLSGSLISKLDKDNQIKNLTINQQGIIKYRNEFSDYFKVQDDLIKFEIRKYIDI